MSVVRSRSSNSLFLIPNSRCLKVCHNRRIGSHRVFKGVAARGKTSVDWFYGLKLHLVVNECGELLNITVTPGNPVRAACAKHLDRKPRRELLNGLSGRIFAPPRLCQ